MSEILKPAGELWFDGPNHTADAIIINAATGELLLIRRRDNGQWALPGGFVDMHEPAYQAAMREAKEEAGVRLEGGAIVYEGVVDDPRNSERAWIETSAYLFVTDDVEATPGDDASDAQWFALDALPPLYASHAAIINHAFTAMMQPET